MYQNEIVDKLKLKAMEANYHNEQMNEIFEFCMDERKTDYKPIDYIDGRKGYMTMFNHCPSCGEAINWKHIKQQLKEISA